MGVRRGQSLSPSICYVMLCYVMLCYVMLCFPLIKNPNRSLRACTPQLNTKEMGLIERISSDEVIDAA
jgi:hypothetical protein